MTGLIEQLQADALDPTVRVATLLRKVRVVAVKLQITDVADWVSHELDGYTGDLPEYRKIWGVPKAFNPYRGWIPIIGPSNFMNTLSQVFVFEPITQLEDLLARDGDGSLRRMFSAEQVNMINESMSVNFGEMGNHIDKSAVSNVVECVRNRILDWALALESKGITGEGLSFTPTEKKMAQGASINITNFAGNIHSGDVSGDGAQLNLTSNKNSIRNDAATAFQQMGDLVGGISDEAERNRIGGELKILEKHANKPSFPAQYAAFMQAAANHMTLIAPALPALAALLNR